MSEMLLAGLDVSGNPEAGNYKFMSIVIGTEESIRAITKQLGREQTHMNTIRGNKIQNEIVSKLKFDNKECVGFCYRIDLSNALKKTNAKFTEVGNIRRRRIFSKSYYIIWSVVQDRVKEFLRRHRCDIYDVVFQCDGDLQGFLKTAGLKRFHKGDAYMIADVLAWANNRGWEPHGAVPLDISAEVESRMADRMK